MPSSQLHGNHQRRIFRGKGGATDGRLPPKKNPRVRVKYQHRNSDEALVDGDVQIESELSNESEEEGAPEPYIEGLDVFEEDGMVKEMKHLQKRVHNIQTSLQTSRGLSNPQTWYNNCLLPVKNAVKEWRSICKFHMTNRAEGTNECTSHGAMVNDTSAQVFNLLQMAMQSGPLVGSNPGYFKRCGSEVALIALAFLKDIADLAWSQGINVPQVEHASASEVIGDATNAYHDATNQTAEDYVQEYDDIFLVSDAFDKIMELNLSSDSSQLDSTFSGGTDEEAGANKIETPMLDHNALPNSQLLVILSLQSTLLFSDKQSQRIWQWMQNADKAANAKKGPSKSSQKLQNQKSKKQMAKELKMERKMKKKKKSGGK